VILVPIGVGVGIGIGIDSDCVLWLVLTHGAAFLPEFLVSKSHLLSFDSDSDSDTDPDYNPWWAVRTLHPAIPDAYFGSS
jgi:hypothetical protein